MMTLILAMVDAEGRMVLYSRQGQELAEVGSLKVHTVDPHKLVAMAATLMEMTQEEAPSSNGHKAQRKERSDKGQRRKVSVKASVPLGTSKLQTLEAMATTPEVWLTAAQIHSRVPHIAREGLSASLSQWTKRGELEDQLVPNPALGTKQTDRRGTARGQTRSEVKAYRITPKGMEALEGLRVKLA